MQKELLKMFQELKFLAVKQVYGFMQSYLPMEHRSWIKFLVPNPTPKNLLKVFSKACFIYKTVF